MYTPPLTASPSIFRASYAAKTNQATVAPTADSERSGSSSKVTLSSAGRNAAYAETATEVNTQNSTAGTPPVEMYSIPEWVADFGFMLPSSLEEANAHPNWFAEKYPKAANAPQSLLVDYDNRFQEHLRTVLDANNIKTTEDFHNALIVDKKKSEEIHQQVVARLLNDPRMVDMMRALDKMPA